MPFSLGGVKEPKSVEKADTQKRKSTGKQTKPGKKQLGVKLRIPCRKCRHFFSDYYSMHKHKRTCRGKNLCAFWQLEKEVLILQYNAESGNVSLTI